MHYSLQLQGATFEIAVTQVVVLKVVDITAGLTDQFTTNEWQILNINDVNLTKIYHVLLKHRYIGKKLSEN